MERYRAGLSQKGLKTVLCLFDMCRERAEFFNTSGQQHTEFANCILRAGHWLADDGCVVGEGGIGGPLSDK